MKICIPDKNLRNVTHEVALKPIEEQFWLAIATAHYSSLVATQTGFATALIESFKIADIATAELIKRR